MLSLSHVEIRLLAHNKVFISFLKFSMSSSICNSLTKRVKGRTNIVSFLSAGKKINFDSITKTKPLVWPVKNISKQD